MAERLLALETAMAGLLLDAAGAEDFQADPAAFAGRHGLEAADGDAMQRQRARLLVYRELVQSALEDPLPDCFPHTHRILEEAGAWRDCVRAFIASRSVQSAYYRDINPAFVVWLAETGWGQDRWPFLLQLAHYEQLELEVLCWPEDPAPAGLFHEPLPHATARFAGTARNLAYGWRVQESREEEPVPPEGAAHLFCYRDRNLEFETLEVDPHTSAFLARCLEGQPLGAAAAAVGLEWTEARSLLRRLQEDGAILGYS